MEEAPSRAPLGLSRNDVDACFKAHAKAINGQLNLIFQEVKRGGVMVGGVTFSDQEVAMDWAWIHLPPNIYQCIAGMVYAMCLMLEAVVHQEDMMKHDKHWERVQGTFIESAQVWSTLLTPLCWLGPCCQRVMS
jgi:hypothetical protein